MSDEVSVRVHGLLRGAELPSDARLVIDPRGVELWSPNGPPATIPFVSLDGVAVRSIADGHAVSLFVAGGDVVEVEPVAAPEHDSDDGARLEGGDYAAALLAAVFPLPELTRALRAFGSRR